MLTGAAAALIAALLAFAPVPAYATIDNVTGMDHWYLTSEAQDPSADDESIDVLAVTGEEGDRVWIDVTKNGEPIAKRLMYQLNNAEVDADGLFVGVLSLDIQSFAPTDVYTISAYADRNDADDAALYTGTVKPVVAVFDNNGATEEAVIALRTQGESDKDREFTIPEILDYKGETYEYDGEDAGVHQYKVKGSSLPDSIEGKVSFYELSTNNLLKENTFTITKEEGSKLVPVDNIIEANGTYYRTLQLTGDVTAKYPGVTEFSVMCVELSNTWGDNNKPFVASFRYVDVDNYDASDPSAASNLKDADSALAQLIDKLIVTKDYSYTPPSYIYIKNGDVVEYWALVTDGDQPASLDENNAIVLSPTVDSTDQSIDIAYKKMDESFDAVWTVTCVDATKGANEPGRILDRQVFTVPQGETKTYTVEEKNGLIPVPGTEDSYTYTYDVKNLIANTTIYYGVKGEDPVDNYDVTVRYVNIANNETLRSDTYTITPDYVMNRTYLTIALDDSFVQGGNNYVRLSGQASSIDHNYYNYDVVNGSKQKVYTIWFRDVNDDLHDNTTVTIYTTVYDEVFVDRGVTSTTVTTTEGTTTAAAGAAAAGAAAAGAEGAAAAAATPGEATLNAEGGLNAITTEGGESTLVRDDGTGVTTERIEDENTPLAGPDNGENGTAATGASAISSNVMTIAQVAAVVLAMLGALLAYFLLRKRDKDEQ